MKKKEPPFLRRLLFLRPFLFGKYCPCCGELLRVFSDDIFCTDCSETLERKKITLPEEELKFPPYFLSLYHYEGAVRKAILAFKFRNEKHIGLFFADKMAEAFLRFPEAKPDFVCGVPAYSLRDGRRYNPPDILAERIAFRINVPYRETLLKKKKNIRSQTKTKNRRERLQNPNGAYIFNPEEDSVRGKTILLVDDIITTGATLRECANELYRAGAETVYRLTIAKTSLFAAKRLIPSEKNRQRYRFKRKVKNRR